MRASHFPPTLKLRKDYEEVIARPEVFEGGGRQAAPLLWPRWRRWLERAARFYMAELH